MTSLKLRASMTVNIKSTSNAIWWIKTPVKESTATAAKSKAKGRRNGAGRKKSVGSSFCLDMADLLRNISLHGYNKLLASELCLWEKLIWLVVHTITFVALVVVLSITWEQFVAQYFVTNLKDPLYPIENVPFPAVSICSNNRISLQAATNYAHELRHNDPVPRDIDYYVEHLKYLGSFYTQYGKTFDQEEYTTFQTFLDVFGTWDNETFFDTRRIMKMLTPTCEQMLIKCTLAGVDVPCMSQTVFTESLTMYGPCCTFNAGNSYKKRKFKNRFGSAELGLVVVLNASTADYLAPILNTNGYITIIHNPDNYASITSSNARDMFPTHNEETFLIISARVVDTDATLRSFSPLSRKCYFLDEAPDPDQLIRSTYTFPNCITRCRIKSVIALCRCLPYYMPLELLETLDGVVYCTLSHLSCIKQYSFKWWNVLTERHAIPGLEREIEEALYCPQCLPSCDDVLYGMSARSLPIDGYLSVWKAGSNDNDTLPMTDVSVLRVYFGEPYANFYIRILNNEWFEVLSTVGNILSIFMGFSLVAMFEILFFVFKYIFVGVDKLIDQNRILNSEKVTKPKEKLIICP